MLWRDYMHDDWTKRGQNEVEKVNETDGQKMQRIMKEARGK